MKVVVTGGTGKAGRAVVRELLEHGYDVLNVDYNVFEAARILGLRRIVWATSETTLGLPFDRQPPIYAPIDEEHPLFPESSYAISKVLVSANVLRGRHATCILPHDHRCSRGGAGGRGPGRAGVEERASDLILVAHRRKHAGLWERERDARAPR